MADPYKVLGVTPDTSDEEITKAYRKLAKKYHPDINPGNVYAEKMMKEINAAYAQIKDKQQGGSEYGQQNASGYSGTSGGSSYGWGNPFGGSWEDIFGFGFNNERQRQWDSDGARMRAVRSYLESRQFYQALRVLAEVNTRDAMWYYYSAIANTYAGNRVTALNHAAEAVRLEPDNQDYHSLMEQIQQNAQQYSRNVTSYGFNLSSVGRTVAGIWLANLAAIFCCRMCL